MTGSSRCSRPTARRTGGSRPTPCRRSRSCGRCGSRAWASPTSSPATSWPGPRAWCSGTSPTPTARCARRCPSGTGRPRWSDLVDWLAETIRQTDSSLLDEWESLSDPEHAPADVLQHDAPPPPRPLSRQERTFAVMIRNAMFARVQLCARDDLDGLVRIEREAADRVEPPRAVVMGRSAWDAALEEYYAEHDGLGTDADARGPSLPHARSGGSGGASRRRGGDDRAGTPRGADARRPGRATTTG